MVQYANRQKVNVKDEKFDVQSMINKALFGILIAKEIVTEEEMIIILGNINRRQEVYSEHHSMP